MVAPFSVVRYWPMASKFSNANPIGSISWWQPLQLLPADQVRGEAIARRRRRA